MNEQDLLIDCLIRLESTDIDYLITGSMASNYWGWPRSTHDLDFVINLHEKQIPKLMDSFAEDFYLDEDMVREAWRPPYQFNAIDNRSSIKVDFWRLRSDPFARERFKRRMRIEIFSTPAWIATAEDVILHKLYWESLNPSDRQLRDVGGVLSVQGDSLDKAYLRKWAEELGVSATLERVLSGEIKPKLT